MRATLLGSIFRSASRAKERPKIVQRLLSAMFTSGIRQHEQPANEQVQDIRTVWRRCDCFGSCATPCRAVEYEADERGIGLPPKTWDDQYISWLEDGDITLGTPLRREIAGRLRELTR